MFHCIHNTVNTVYISDVPNDATQEELQSLRDNMSMELLWLEEAISSRKQVSPGSSANKTKCYVDKGSTTLIYFQIALLCRPKIVWCDAWAFIVSLVFHDSLSWYRISVH